MAKNQKPQSVTITNRRAWHDYHIGETFEAGIVLSGTEVKSVRQGRASLQEAYCKVEGGEVFIIGMHISPYEQGNRYNLDPLRPRKLLLHREEIRRIERQLQQKGYTLIPLKLYFVRGYAKLQIALARGKKLYDKREAIARRDAELERRRAEAGRLDY
ncbi:MAG: SsrA-binding protein SmpB [Armatimonadota bacterium]|nr:SsrA-binding protein SmpB [Armatimonadota bacterium]